MQKQNKRNRKITDNLLNIKIEEDYHRSPLQRVLHIICFISPIAAAFLGYFISSPVWNLFSKNQCPEFFKFAISLLLFFITITIIFVKTRNTNPTMKIRVSNIQDKTEN